MHQHLKKWQRWLISLLVVVGCMSGSFVIGHRLLQDEQQATPVSMAQWQHASCIFIYSSRCPTCRHVYPLVWMLHLWKPIVFVNVTNPYNRQLVLHYQIDEVPTLKKGQVLYQGHKPHQMIKFIMQST